jgi:hypothetical protein
MRMYLIVAVVRVPLVCSETKPLASKLNVHVTSEVDPVGTGFVVAISVLRASMISPTVYIPGGIV